MTASSDFEIIATTNLANYSFLQVQSRLVRDPGGSESNRYVIVHPGAVAVVPLDDDGAVTLIEQYRAPVDSWVLEIPAGKLDTDDADSEATARRELAEEVGMAAGTLTRLGSIQTGVGFTDEEITIFLATDLSVGASAPDGPEEAAARRHRISFEDAIDKVRSGEIKDSKTIAGLMLTELHLRKAEPTRGTP